MACAKVPGQTFDVYLFRVCATRHGSAKEAASPLITHIEPVIISTLSLTDRFKRAVSLRDTAALRELLPHRDELQAVINEPSFGFDSPALVEVAGEGDAELVDVLLQLGADPNRRSTWWAGGFHPLYSATGDVAERLLAAGAVVDASRSAQSDRIRGASLRSSSRCNLLS